MRKFIQLFFRKDHFFWDMYEAQRSPDSKAITFLIEQYSNK